MKRFAAVASANEDNAMKVLKDAGWDLEVAFENFFAGSHTHGTSSSSSDLAMLEALYAKYRATNEDIVGVEGILKFCEDIEIDPIDPVILVISLKMSAQSMGRYTKDEFVSGMRRMACDSVASIKQKLPSLRAELKDDDKFKEIYDYSFTFSKEPNQKSLPLDTASAMWKVLLTDRWKLVDAWCEFLATEHNKAITQDTWSQILQFSRTIGPNMQGYDPAGAWPYLIDGKRCYL